MDEYVMMDHQAQVDHDVSLEEFFDKVRAWLKPGQWINVQFSTGDPTPVECVSLIVKRPE